MKKHLFRFRRRKDLKLLLDLKKRRSDLLSHFEKDESLDFNLEKIIKGEAKVSGKALAFKENQSFLDIISTNKVFEKKESYNSLYINYQTKVLNKYIKGLIPIFESRSTYSLYKKVKFFNSSLLFSKDKTFEVSNLNSFICMVLVSVVHVFVNFKRQSISKNSRTFQHAVSKIRLAIKSDVIFKMYKKKLDKVDTIQNKIFKQKIYNEATHEFEVLYETPTIDRLFTACCIDILDILCGTAKLALGIKPLNPVFLKVYIEKVNSKSTKYIILRDPDLISDNNLYNYASIFGYPMIYPKDYNEFLENQGSLVIGTERFDKIKENNFVSFHMDKKTGKFPGLECLSNLHNVGYRVNIQVLGFIINNYNQMELLNILTPSSTLSEVTLNNPNLNIFQCDLVYKKLAQQRLSESYILSTALYFAKYNNLFFDVSVDGRGRVYFASNFLSIQGPSLSKSLLEFSEAKSISINSCAFQDWVILGLHLLGYKHKVQYNNPVYNLILLNKSLSPVVLSKSDGVLLEFIQNLSKDKFVFLGFYFEYLTYCSALDKRQNSFSSRFLANLDATSSSFQIISALTKDFKMSQACNILNNKLKPRDVYLELVLKTINKYINIPFDQRVDVQTARYSKKGKVTSMSSLE
jgi:hypothetical protein